MIPPANSSGHPTPHQGASVARAQGVTEDVFVDQWVAHAVNMGLAMAPTIPELEKYRAEVRGVASSGTHIPFV